VLAIRESSNPITRKIDDYPAIAIYPEEDILVYGESYADIFQRELKNLMRSLHPYMHEDVITDHGYDPKKIGPLIKKSGEALEAGFRALMPYRGRSQFTGGAQDARQMKMKSTPRLGPKGGI